MSIKELAVFPRITYVEGQGQIGVRKWLLDHDDDITQMLQIISDSHWPGRKGCLPISIEEGPFFDEAIIKREPDDPRTYQSLGALADISQHAIIARYALHRVNNCWPESLGLKPYHPSGTTLTIESSGGSQDILAAPPGIRSIPPDAAICTGEGAAISPGVLGRMIFVTTEYAITCDRLTADQVSDIFEIRHWDTYQGCVNYTDPLDGLDGLVAAPHGTLLFDGYKLQPTMIAHSDSPHRYRLSAHLRRRIVLERPDSALEQAPATILYHDGLPVGWNHDYVNVASEDKRWDWRFVSVFQAGACVPRYPFVDMSDIFRDQVGAVNDDCDDETEETSELGDCDLCVPAT